MLCYLLAFFSAFTCFADDSEVAKKSIVVVICSYNNQEYYRKNLQTVLDQEYAHFRVIYVDDCSPDGTGEAVANFIKEHPHGNKVQLIRNKSRKKAMSNLWHAIHSCRDEEIVVTVDGDDWLPHNKVLSIVASYYNDPNVWLAYSNSITHPEGKPGISRPINFSKDKGVRQQPFVTSHLRSFYAGLFKRIRLQDLVFNGGFVSTTHDIAMLSPMLEMAAGHICFMKEKLYIYNSANPLSDCRSHGGLQEKIRDFIKKLPPYQPLSVHPAITLHKPEDTQVDVVTFSYNRPMQLYAYLQSLYRHTQNFNLVTVIYRADNEEYEKGYKIVKEQFPEVKCYRQTNPPKDFKKLTLQAVYNPNSVSKFVVFAVDDIIIKDKIDFYETAALLNKTGAYGFYLRMGKNINRSYMAGKADAPPTLLEVDSNTYTWRFSTGGAEWGYPHSVDMTVYRKCDIRSYFEKGAYSNPNYLEGRWAKQADKSKFGLCYGVSKIINIPMNIVSSFRNKNLNFYSAKELLTKFLEGDKIDIDAVYQMVNHSPHVNVHPKFIKDHK